MISVAEARARITSALIPVSSEIVSVAEASGRVLAEDVCAAITQPPAAVSAMDGYALCATDLEALPATLSVIGEAAAGGAFAGALGPGQAVRIFTGGPVPEGADTIVVQEDVVAEGASIVVGAAVPAGTYIRPVGLDFTTGDLGVAAGTRLGAREVGLAAAMNRPWLTVRRRPRVALLATGDEIVRPGEPVGRDQIVSSNTLALAALLSANGAEPVDLGIALDNRDSLLAMAAGAAGADLLITMGGASVGDHDLVQSVLGERGLEVDFWRIAMRPGKPLMFGTLGPVPMLGLPGNPVSSLVCGLIFVLPALRALLGLPAAGPRTEPARLGRDLAANDRREDYLRATLSDAPTLADTEGHAIATPFEIQDSSMFSLLTQADCLVLRPPHAPAARAGDAVEMIRLAPSLAGY